MDVVTKNICIFGDSIAYGEWSKNGGWVDHMQMMLQDKVLDLKFQKYFFLYNLSIPGNTTKDILMRIDGECSARDPHIIIFAVGINDTSSIGNVMDARINKDMFKKNISTLVDVARRYTQEIIWIGLTRVDEARTMPFEQIYFFNARIEEYDILIKQICKELNIRYVSVSHILKSYDLEDGLHPNTQGHEKLSREIYNILFK